MRYFGALKERNYLATQFGIYLSGRSFCCCYSIWLAHAITTMMFCDDIFIADTENTALKRDIIFHMARAYHSYVNLYAEMWTKCDVSIIISPFRQPKKMKFRSVSSCDQRSVNQIRLYDPNRDLFADLTIDKNSTQHYDVKFSCWDRCVEWCPLIYHH